MKIISTVAAMAAIVVSLTMAQVVRAEEPQAPYDSSQLWMSGSAEIDDHPPMETTGRAAVLAYVGCGIEDCVPPQAVRISDGLPGYLEPAPTALSRPERKPYYDAHVEGTHRVLVGFLIMEHCQCSEPGYVIRHRQILLKAKPEDFQRVRAIYLGTLAE